MRTTFLTLISILFLTCLNVKGQHKLAPLPYAYNALEPTVDAKTMEIHYSKHHAGYVRKLNNALKNSNIKHKDDLLAIFKNVSKYSTAIRNNAGGHFNHTMFWKMLTPKKGTKPSEKLLKAINKKFGNLKGLKTAITKRASKVFGSGWAWLIINSNKELEITTTANQNNPLMDDAKIKGTPILCIDVWEHAYYLKYQNNRGVYLKALANIFNWEMVSSLYKKGISK